MTMKIVMEKYHGCENDYLIWDPVKNRMQLDFKRVKAIHKGNLGFGCAGILYGPIVDDKNSVFKVFDSKGREDKPNGESIGIFLKYMRDAGYEPSNTIAFAEGKTFDQKQDNAYNIGFIILNSEFVKELEII